MTNTTTTHMSPRLPKAVTLDIISKPFGLGFLYMAAWQGQESTGPYGRGNDVRDAINQLVDVTEEIIAEAA